MVDREVIELVSDRGNFAVRLEEAEVTQVALDYRFVLTVHDGGPDALQIVISTPLEFMEPGQTTPVRVDPESAETSLGQLVMAARHQPLTSCIVDGQSGKLALRLGELAIEVPPSPDFEAWDLDHPRFKLVSMAGGEVAVWDL